MNFNFRAWDKYKEAMYVVEGIDFIEQAVSVRDEDVPKYFKTLYLDDSVVLMQSTGMKDSSGKEIYEWDIVEMKPTVFAEPQLYMVFRHYGGEYRLDSTVHGCPLWLRLDDVKVIGNVFENPDWTNKDFVDMRMRDVERWHENNKTS